MNEENFFNQLDEMIEEQKILESKIKALKNNILSHIPKTQNMTKDIKLSVLNKIYWCYPQLQAQDIFGHLGKQISKLSKDIVVPVYDTGLICCDCGEMLKITSRTAYKILKSNLNNRCKVCEKKRDVERKKFWDLDKSLNAQRIKELKLLPYKEYLSSQHWQSLRKSMLRRSHYKCQLCNEGGILDVHHRTYENKGDEDYSDLIVLCRNCHSKFHKTPNTTNETT